MPGLLAAIAPVLLQAGTSYFSQKSAQKQRKKERREAERRAAYANMVSSLGGRSMAPEMDTRAVQGDPVWAAAQGLSADPLVKEHIENLVNKLMGNLPEIQTQTAGKAIVGSHSPAYTKRVPGRDVDWTGRPRG